MNQAHDLGSIPIDHDEIRLPGGELQWCEDQSRILPFVQSGDGFDLSPRCLGILSVGGRQHQIGNIFH